MVFCNMYPLDTPLDKVARHNPYFNRWFSAINISTVNMFDNTIVTILILIDGFLQ